MECPDMAMWGCGEHNCRCLLVRLKCGTGGRIPRTGPRKIVPRLKLDSPIITHLDYCIESIIYNYCIGYYHTYSVCRSKSLSPLTHRLQIIASNSLCTDPYLLSMDRPMKCLVNTTVLVRGIDMVVILFAALWRPGETLSRKVRQLNSLCSMNPPVSVYWPGPARYGQELVELQLGLLASWWTIVSWTSSDCDPSSF